MHLIGFSSLLREKCAVRGVSFEGPEDLFHGRMLAYVEGTWEQMGASRYRRELFQFSLHSVVINQFDVVNVLSFKSEDDAPVGLHGYGCNVSIDTCQE